jgi:hypothetical protein
MVASGLFNEAGAGRLFEWAHDNCAGTAARGQLTHDGAIRENHVVEFEEGRRIAWRPAESPP